MRPQANTAATSDLDFERALEGARRADPAALEELFQRLYPRVEGLVHAGLARDIRGGRPWLGARFSTGDVVQDVFRHLLKDLAGFAGRTEGALIGYLAASVRHRLIDAVRFHEAAQRDGRRTIAPPEGYDPRARMRTPVSDLVSAEEIEAFHQVLLSFPEKERYLLRARIEENTSFQDLAEQLDYSSKAAARRAFFAAQAQLVVRLRKRLPDSYDIDSYDIDSCHSGSYAKGPRDTDAIS